MSCDRCGAPEHVFVKVRDGARSPGEETGLRLCRDCDEALRIRMSYEQTFLEVLAVLEEKDDARALELWNQFWRDNCQKETEGWLAYAGLSLKSDVHAACGQIESALSIYRRLDQQCWHRLSGHVTNKLTATQLMKEAGKVKEATGEIKNAIEHLNNYLVVTLIWLFRRYAILVKEQGAEIPEKFLPLLLYLKGETGAGLTQTDARSPGITEIVDSLKAPFPLMPIF